MTQASAGWYSLRDGTQRYWDGAAWTEHVAPGVGVAAPQQSVTPQASVVAEAPQAPVAAEPPQASPTLAVPPAAAEPWHAYAAAPSQVPPEGFAAKPKRRVWPWIVGVVGGLIVLGVVAVIAIMMVFEKALSGPMDVASAFNDAYFSGDCEAYLDVTTADFRDTDGFPGTCDEAADLYFPTIDEDSFSITLDIVTMIGSSATVTGSVSSIDYGDGSVIYELVKVDGKWKVDSTQSFGS